MMQRWTEYGGNGPVAGSKVGARGSLAIQQPMPVHRVDAVKPHTTAGGKRRRRIIQMGAGPVQSQAGMTNYSQEQSKGSFLQKVM